MKPALIYLRNIKYYKKSQKKEENTETVSGEARLYCTCEGLWKITPQGGDRNTYLYS